jgi:hypothetical protein
MSRREVVAAARRACAGGRQPTRPLAESLIGFRTPLNEVVDAWLRAMALEEDTDAAPD